ncbi:unnamed protein product [Lactuca virosa]|uniref:Uncharacterized protein n=1 Tax=Lactuca virosa TaxID=75947 RepID=A0AAU9MFV5_9ASTR|nr:unnamed protein product [Lactuca virosa]
MKDTSYATRLERRVALLENLNAEATAAKEIVDGELAMVVEENKELRGLKMEWISTSSCSTSLSPISHSGGHNLLRNSSPAVLFKGILSMSITSSSRPTLGWVSSGAVFSSFLGTPSSSRPLSLFFTNNQIHVIIPPFLQPIPIMININ